MKKAGAGFRSNSIRNKEMASIENSKQLTNRKLVSGAEKIFVSLSYTVKTDQQFILNVNPAAKKMLNAEAIWELCSGIAFIFEINSTRQDIDFN